MYNIGIDIGATNTKLVLLKGVKIIRKEKFSTPQERKKLIKALESRINKIADDFSKSKIKKIGIGVPSPLDKKRAFILDAPNLKYLTNFSLDKIVEKNLKIKTIMENDANCFTLAETVMGAGKGAKIVAGITLGTGVGGGIVQDGKVIKGVFGSAGEFGFITINFGSKFSILDEYCSEKFFKRKKLYSKTLDDKAKKGDKKAKKVFEKYGKYLGIGLSNLINILDPEVVVIGGGISKAHKFFMPSVKREIQTNVLSPMSRKFVKIKIAKLKDFSGAVGAALL